MIQRESRWARLADYLDKKNKRKECITCNYKVLVDEMKIEDGTLLDELITRNVITPQERAGITVSFLYNIV